MSKKRKPGNANHRGRRQRPESSHLPTSSPFVFHAPPSPHDRNAYPLLRLLAEAAEAPSGQAFAESVQLLEHAVCSVDPLVLLSTMSISHLMHPAGVDAESLFRVNLLQFHLEWLQAFCLRFNAESYASPTALGPGILERVSRLLLRITLASIGERWNRRLATLGAEPAREAASYGVREQARIEQLAVRNWSYHAHMAAIVSDLCRRLDGWAGLHLGFPLSPLPALFLRMEQDIERRYNEQQRQLRLLLRHTKSAVGFCRRWRDSSLPGATQSEELERLFRSGQLKNHELAYRLMAAVEQANPTLLTFTAHDMAALTEGQLDATQVQQVTHALSYHLGDLASHNIDHLTLNNPVWTKPFIALGNGNSFCAVPGGLLSHCLDLIGALVTSVDAEKWSTARSRFLEERLGSLLKDGFPNAVVHLNSKPAMLPEKGDFENDAAVILGDAVVVAEARSHEVPLKARIGWPDQMRTSIETLVLKPSHQSQAFANYLLQDVPSEFRDRHGQRFVLDGTGVRQLIRLNVVLDPFPLARASTASLRGAHLVREDEPDPALTLLLTDLESVLALLPDELQRLHYLARRQTLLNTLQYVGKEHDFLALYVDEGFQLADLTSTSEIVFNRLASKQVDPYLERHFSGARQVRRPERQLRPWWGRILHQLSEQRGPDWVSIGLVVLDATPDQQVEMQTLTKAAARTVTSGLSSSPIEVWELDVGLPWWRSTIVGVVVQDRAAEDVDSPFRELPEQLWHSESTTRVLLHFAASSARTAFQGAHLVVDGDEITAVPEKLRGHPHAGQETTARRVSR